MPPVGFEPTISASERPQTYALDRAAIGTGSVEGVVIKNFIKYLKNRVLTKNTLRVGQKAVLL